MDFQNWCITKIFKKSTKQLFYHEIKKYKYFHCRAGHRQSSEPGDPLSHSYVLLYNMSLPYKVNHCSALFVVCENSSIFLHSPKLAATWPSRWSLLVSRARGGRGTKQGRSAQDRRMQMAYKEKDHKSAHFRQWSWMGVHYLSNLAD